MNHVLNKLQDVQNSKRALIEKLASIQIELFTQADADLEAAVDSALSAISQTTEDFNAAVDQYQMKVNVENQNHPQTPAETTS